MNRSSFILTYHSIDDSNSVISVSPQELRGHLDSLEASGRRIVPLENILDHPGAVALTFDDGFRNFREHALPLLQEKRMPATVFVVTGYCGGKNDWPSQSVDGVPLLDLMSWSELDEIARQGITLGAHTVTHPHLNQLAPVEAAREMGESRRAIEERTGRRVTAFAYPYGSLSPRVRALAAAQFSIGCTTELSFLGAGYDALQLPRLDSYYLRAPRTFELLQHSRGQLYIGVRRGFRALRKRYASTRFRIWNPENANYRISTHDS